MPDNTAKVGSFRSANAVGRSTFARYAVAIVAVLLSWAVREALTTVWRPTELPFIFLYPPIVLAAWYGRRGPALLAIILSALLANWFFIEPTHSFRIQRASDVVALVSFVVVNLFLVAAIELMHRSNGRIATERELFATTLTSIGDAVIVTDGVGGITSLNAEAERLTGWTNEEATGRSLADIFKVLNEQTREPVENPVEKVLRLGTVTGLANHTVLIARDGREIPIDDSAAPIRGNGHILGVVLVFRDVTEQRRAHRARARLAEVVKYSGDAIITKDLNGIITSWNDSAKRLFGYEADEIIGKPVTVFFPTDRLNEEDYILERLRQGKPSERLETIRLKKDGTPIHVSVNVSPLKDADGQVIGASKIIHDVTDLVAARQELTREKELLATTLASIGDAVILTDEKGRVTFLNAEAERLTAWANDDAGGRPLNEVFRIINEQTRETVENPVEKVMRLGGVVGLANHTLLIAKDGREIPIDDSAAPIREPGGPLFGVVLVFRDFTQRRMREEQLAEQARLLDLSNDAIIIRDANDQVMYWNHGAEELYGYSREEALGKVAHDLLKTTHPQPLPSVLEILRREGRWEGELVHTRRDGSKITTFSRWALDGNEQGNAKSILETNNNITARKKIEKEREQLLAREHELRQLAEEANRIKDEFLAIMSHELRNPLNVILGYSQLLVRTDEIAQSPQLQRMAEAIKRNALAQSQLIRDLLDLSRLRSGKLELNRETVSLMVSINNALDTVRADAEGKQIRIEVIAPDGAMFVEGDPVRLEQIVWNLLNNSIKFTPPGGRITVRANKDGNQVSLSIEDTGQGIDSLFLPHVFEMFRQADGGPSRTQTGMGIGLAVVQQLAQLHRGTMSAHSEGPGKGATFTLKLPLSSEPKTQPAPVPDLGTPLDQLAVLVVDDSEDTTQMLAQLLRMTGATVTGAASGGEALRLMAERTFDVVLSDISMPEMDGFEFLRKLRRLPGYEEAPVLALTGFGRPEDIEKARAEGFFSHVTKPIELEALVDVLKRLPLRKKLARG